ncbi:MAG: HesB/YadR/YfhF-family protein [Actinomycetota bacterium]
MVRITPAALEVIKRSLALAGATDVGVRLRMAGGAVRPRFAAEPEPTDVVVERSGVRVFVADSVLEGHDDVEIDVTAEHETLLVRPIGSQP